MSVFVKIVTEDVIRYVNRKYMTEQDHAQLAASDKRLKEKEELLK
jgi:hypothetical protein